MCRSSRLPQSFQTLPMAVQLAFFCGSELSILGGAALLAYLRHVAPLGWNGWPHP